MYAPDVSTTWVRSTVGTERFSISFFPNSRFMNEFAVISPDVSGPWLREAGGAGAPATPARENRLGERHGRVNTAGGTSRTVPTIQPAQYRPVLHRDVRRISHHHVILSARGSGSAHGEVLGQETHVANVSLRCASLLRLRYLRFSSSNRRPCSRLSPSGDIEFGSWGPPGAVRLRLARSADTNRRNRAIAAANGLMSTPWTPSRAR